MKFKNKIRRRSKLPIIYCIIVLRLITTIQYRNPRETELYKCLLFIKTILNDFNYVGFIALLKSIKVALDFSLKIF